MTSIQKTSLKLLLTLSVLSSGTQAQAFFFDPGALLESQLLRTIDEEFLRLSEDSDELEWTEDAGVQPIDGYELDYAEKCEFIRGTRNKKALAACAVIVGAS